MCPGENGTKNDDVSPSVHAGEKGTKNACVNPCVHTGILAPRMTMLAHVIKHVKVRLKML